MFIWFFLNKNIKHIIDKITDGLSHSKSSK
jgi:hypothetical protein